MSVATSTPTTSVDTESCVHHWKLAAPDGPTTPGECKRCGAQRLFRTTDDETMRADGTLVNQEQHARAVRRANAARRAMAS